VAKVNLHQEVALRIVTHLPVGHINNSEALETIEKTMDNSVQDAYYMSEGKSK
jgi:hypothetical protein